MANEILIGVYVLGCVLSLFYSGYRDTRGLGEAIFLAAAWPLCIVVVLIALPYLLGQSMRDVGGANGK